MTYKQWLKTYNARKNKFIAENEREFGKLLTTARKGIYVPDDINDKYRKHINGVMGDYTDNFYSTMEKQLSAGAKFELAGATLAGAGFIAALAGRAAAPSETVATIAKTVVEDTFSRTLPSGITLSERIWDLNYSKDIVSIVQNGLTNHLGPELISKQLDSFVLPIQQQIVFGKAYELPAYMTTKPYDRLLGNDSMRLARTEVMRSLRETQFESMRQTPWITGVVWDGSDGCAEICEPLDGTVYGSESEIPDTHPNCNCTTTTELMPNEEWDNALDNYFQTGTDEIGISEWLQE